MNRIISSPMNYIGGKYKLLPQLLPLFPDKINTFVDDLISRLSSTDTSKLITNIDLEVLCKVLTEKERC